MRVCIRHNSIGSLWELELTGYKITALEFLVLYTEPLNFFYSTKLVKVDYALPKF